MKVQRMRRREFIPLLAATAAAWPLAARAQQQAMPVVGFLALRPLSPDRSDVPAFRQGLAAAGFVEGRNLAIEYRSANNQVERLAPLAAELVQREVTVIVALDAGPAVRAAKAATSTIPIVFAFAGDPIKFGFVASLNRPGGNMTGVSFLSDELLSKQLDLLCEMAPRATTIAYLTDPGVPLSEEQTSDVLAAGGTLGRQIIVVEARNGSEIDTAFATLLKRGRRAHCSEPSHFPQQ